MALSYENFDLRITLDEQIYATSDEGEVGPVALRLNRNEIGLALQLIEQEGANQELVRELGRQLYRALFDAEVLAHFERSRAAAPDRRLRLRLRIEPNDLVIMPWEFMFDGAEFLGLSLDTPIVRYPEVPTAVSTLQVQGPLRILVVIASPANYPDLDREAQAAALKATFSAPQAEGIIEVEFLLHATYTGLMRWLRSGEFHVLHYLGYSAFDTESRLPVLLFEEENGLARKVSGDELSGLLLREDLGRLTKGERALRLVLINDCESSAGPAKNFAVGVATSLVRSGVPAALAMQYTLPDSVARKFASEFYAALVRSLPIDAATAAGRAAIKSEAEAGAGQADNAVPGEWGAPVLFMHAEDGQLFEPRQARQLAFARSTEQVYTEIESFKVETKDRITRFLIDHLWQFSALTAAGLLAYWVQSGVFDVMLIGNATIMFASIWLLRSLFREKVPATLDKLWRRRLILPREEGNPADQYLEFLKEYNALLNRDRYVWALRSLGLAIAIVTLLGLNPQYMPYPWDLLLRWLIYAMAPLAGYVVGTLLWKMIATVIATRRLSYRFDLDVRPTHPDKCGGLKPLGDLYFAHAQVVLLGGLYVAAWVLLLTFAYTRMERHVVEDLSVPQALVDDHRSACRGYQVVNAPASVQGSDASLNVVCPYLNAVEAEAEAELASAGVLYYIQEKADPEPDSVVVRLAWWLLDLYHWLPLLQVVLAILAIVALITFLFPMWNTHRTMHSKGQRFRQRADSLVGEIAELERYIETYGTTSIEEGTEIERQRRWLEDRYQQYQAPPGWPFDTRIAVRMFGSIATMAGSLAASELVLAALRLLRRVL